MFALRLRAPTFNAFKCGNCGQKVGAYSSNDGIECPYCAVRHEVPSEGVRPLMLRALLAIALLLAVGALIGAALTRWLFQ